jgi:lipopolysaccharide transport system permease protein
MKAAAGNEHPLASQATAPASQRSHPILGSRPVTPRRLTVIRPPEFSFHLISSGLATLLGYRDLLYTLTVVRLSIRYKQSILGPLWAILQPLALMTVYTLIFSRVAKVSSDGAPYPLFVFSGLLPWIFFSSAISNSINGLIHYPALLTKMYFPREIIPLSYVFAALVDFGIACFLLGGLMAYYRVSLSWNVLYLLPIIAILTAFTAAFALVLSSIQSRFRDVGVALPLLLQVGMFAAPVVYSISAVPLRFRKLFLINPLATLLDNFRRVLIHGLAPDMPMLITAGVVTLCLLVAAYGYFKATEGTMADTL